MVSVKTLVAQQHQHPSLDNGYDRGGNGSRRGFSLFNRGRGRNTAASIMSPPSEHERLKQTWEQNSEISGDQRNGDSGK